MAGGLFSRLKVWLAGETVNQPDLNNEFNNIIQNFSPDKMASFSQTVSQMQTVLSPGSVGSEHLAASTAEEIEELRYMTKAITGEAQWYSSPANSILGLNTLINGVTGIPSTRIVSGAADSNNQPMFLVPSGATNAATLKATATPLVTYLQGTQYSFPADITISGLSTAPGSNNTCVLNDATLSGNSSKIAGQNTDLFIKSVGSNITALNGQYAAFKVGAEYFVGEVSINSATLSCSMATTYTSFSVSFSNASPTVVTATDHGLTPSQAVVFSGGSLPTGVVAGTTYYINQKTSDTFNISLSAGGANVNTSSTGTGTCYPIGNAVVTCASHGLSNNDQIIFSGGSLPTGITAATVYYVTVLTSGTFYVSATLGGAYVTIGVNGSGTGTPPKYTVLKNCLRGVAFDSSNVWIPRVTVSNGDTVTLEKLAWIFATYNTTPGLAVTYNRPYVSYATPTSPASGDYWFDLSTSKWKSFNGSSWNETLAIPIGIIILNTTACVAARSFYEYAPFSALNTMELAYVDTANVRTKKLGATVSSFGTTFAFNDVHLVWNNTNNLDSGTTIGASTTYYLYISSIGQQFISNVAPYIDKKYDVLGSVHPSKLYRCIGEIQTDGASLFTSTSLSTSSYFGIAVASGQITNDMMAPLSVGAAQMNSGIITTAMMALPNYAISGSTNAGRSGTGFTSTTPAAFLPLSQTLTCAGTYLVEIQLVDDNATAAATNDVGACLTVVTTVGGNNYGAWVQVLRNGTVISNQVVNGYLPAVSGARFTMPPSAFRAIDLSPPAGVNTYAVYLAINPDATTASVKTYFTNTRLLVREIR